MKSQLLLNLNKTICTTYIYTDKVSEVWNLLSMLDEKDWGRIKSWSKILYKNNDTQMHEKVSYKKYNFSSYLSSITCQFYWFSGHFGRECIMKILNMSGSPPTRIDQEWDLIVCAQILSILVRVSSFKEF